MTVSELDDDLDLSRYAHFLLRWHRLILLCGILGAAAAFAYGSLGPPSYSAEAQLAVVRSSSTLTLDPRFNTISEADRTSGIDEAARRRAFVAMGMTLDLAQAVSADLAATLDAKMRDPEVLLRTVTVINDGSLIRVQARASTPEQAAQIANRWAELFAARVNAVYGGATIPSHILAEQIEAATQEYDSNQQALLDFLANNPIERLTRRKEMLSKELDDRAQLERKLKLLIADATALREQLKTGGSANSGGSDLAAVLIEASAFSQGAELPEGLQFSIDQSGKVLTNEEQGRRIDALLSVLQAQLEQVTGAPTDAQIAELNQLEVQIEAENAKKEALIAARDLARDAHKALAAKLAERRILEQAGSSVLQLASRAAPSNEPVSTRRLVNTVLGGLIGLGLGAAVAFVLHRRSGQRGFVRQLLETPPR